MSHIVTIQTKVRDVDAATAACRRLELAEPTVGTAALFGGTVDGLLIRLPSWTYPVVVDLATGDVKFDNYGGAWGEQAKLNQFLQMYAVEKAKLEARKKGFAVIEQSLQDGSIRLQIQEGAV